MKKNEKENNFLEFIPNKKCEWERVEEGKIQLSIPRFKVQWLKRWAMRMGRSEYIKVTLDELGAKVWESIDGIRTVGQIAELLDAENKAANNEPMIQPYERVSFFLTNLLRHRLIEVKNTKK